MEVSVMVEARELRVSVERKDGFYLVEVDGRVREIDCRPAGHRDYLSLIVDNKPYLVESIPVKPDEGRYSANISGRRYDIEVLDERLIATRRAAVIRDEGYSVIRSPMPGLIVDVRVKAGDRIEAGVPVVVIEAMKMQNELVSETAGIVKSVHVEPQDTVESQAALIEIGSEE
jgi:biotin carboxyl carrier protein